MSTPPPTTQPADPRLLAVRQHLVRVERRYRLRDAVRLAPLAVAAALGYTALLGALWRVTGWGSLAIVVGTGAGLVAVALMLVLAYALLRPRDLMATARHADRELGLDERLSTALEDSLLEPSNPTSTVLSLRDAQLDDTVQAIASVAPERSLPLTAERRHWLPALALAGVVALVVLYPAGGPAVAQPQVDAQIAAEQQSIEALKLAVEAQPNAATDRELQELLRELDELSADLQEGDLSREEALARLSETEEELRRALDAQAQARREALDRMAEQLAQSENDAAKKAGEALKQGDTDRAAEELEKAAREAEQMTPEERRELAETLRQARDSAAPLDPELANRLNEAADALERGDSEAAEQALDNLSAQVDQTGEQLATQRQLEQALAQIQQSKENVAQSGNPTPAPGQATAVAGTAIAQGTTLPGTPLAQGTPVQVAGTAVPGTPGTPGTPVLVQGTPGQGTPVAAQGQGQGQGQGAGQGQGQGAGQGQGQGQGQGAGQGANAGQQGGGWGVGHDEPVYVPPTSVDAASTAVAVQGQDNPGGEQSSTSVETDVNTAGPALTPYDEVYGEYRDRAGSALDSDYIPQGYKDLVRDYFTQLEPQP
jgi:chemotaxis protein histidine kinase CheA